jgi:hypothetical protein
MHFTHFKTQMSNEVLNIIHSYYEVGNRDFDLLLAI